ncbi:hypothetical protein K1719_032856 [Acacia pycnantha]|nr:hypothetical protein K1719_032856 [Acacia pycnantha]
MFNHLPLEIVEEILHRLPVKSIVKCTSICKAWNSLITLQTFIYDHLNRTIQAPNHNSSLFFQCRKLISPDDPRSVHQEETYSLYSSINQQTDQFSVERFPLSHLFEPNRYPLFVGACNGLVCSVDYSPLKSATIIIWNPSLRKYIVLPKPITTHKKRSRHLCGHVDPNYGILFGFGFDSRNNDYKVVRLMNDRCTKDTLHIEVYSLASHIWRSISVTVPQFFLDHSWLPSVLLNGSLHWLVWRYAAFDEAAYDEEGVSLNYRFILSFDVIQETFRELTLPQQQPNEKAVISILLPVEGSQSLALVNHVNMKRRSEHVFCIWVMKDYGITNSWTEIFRLDDRLYGGIFTVLALFCVCVNFE